MIWNVLGDDAAKSAGARCVCCGCLDPPDQDRDTYLVNTNVHFIAMIRPIEDKLE